MSGIIGGAEGPGAISFTIEYADDFKGPSGMDILLGDLTEVLSNLKVNPVVDLRPFYNRGYVVTLKHEDAKTVLDSLRDDDFIRFRINNHK